MQFRVARVTAVCQEIDNVAQNNVISYFYLFICLNRPKLKYSIQIDNYLKIKIEILQKTHRRRVQLNRFTKSSFNGLSIDYKYLNNNMIMLYIIILYRYR